MRFVHPRLRPFALSAAVAAAIAALFQPVPAMADPVSTTGSVASVPDTGSRPTSTGSLVLPGAPVSTPSPTTPSLIIPGVAASPIIQKVEKGRAEIAALGDQLIRVGQERDLAQTQLTNATQRVTATEQAVVQARASAKDAASDTIQQAAALPPGAIDSGLAELDALARMQLGDASSYEAAARRLLAAEEAARTAVTDRIAADSRYTTIAAQWTTLNTNLTKKQAAQAKLEADNRAEITAAETRATAADQQLGAEYLAGNGAGRGADPRAVKAVEFALAQRGDPYVWSEEGPDQYDCSGLMFAAYRGVGYPLVRVSRDQYYQTRDRQVSRYSLLPGDLLFFSSSSSWTGIHHVAMYAGEGMMVEAPRSGLNVRLAPVRWTRLFAATRIFGSIEGETETPDLGAPDPDEPVSTKTPTPGRTTTKPPGGPSPSTTTKPPAGGSPNPGNSSSSPATSPSTSTSPSGSSSPSTSASPSASTAPSVTPDPTTGQSQTPATPVETTTSKTQSATSTSSSATKPAETTTSSSATKSAGTTTSSETTTSTGTASSSGKASSPATASKSASSGDK
ncbi:NlpC/P60 family protein [Actinoplanes sp. NPDC023801]|uniref:C40 family peptidase n=1 Tax=Actinoplanes sp. NPDC023801 TaxID=3154595 RepID=UPI0033E956B6